MSDDIERRRAQLEDTCSGLERALDRNDQDAALLEAARLRTILAAIPRAVTRHDAASGEAVDVVRERAHRLLERAPTRLENARSAFRFLHRFGSKR